MIQLDSRRGAPEALCRQTTPSAPIASSVSAVSFRLSPLETLEPLAEKVITSAERRLAADLEAGAGPGGVLEEEVHHRPAAQRRQLLDRAVADERHLLGGVEDERRLVAA